MSGTFKGMLKAFARFSLVSFATSSLMTGTVFLLFPFLSPLFGILIWGGSYMVAMEAFLRLPRSFKRMLLKRRLMGISILTWMVGVPFMGLVLRKLYRKYRDPEIKTSRIVNVMIFTLIFPLIVLAEMDLELVSHFLVVFRKMRGKVIGMLMAIGAMARAVDSDEITVDTDALEQSLEEVETGVENALVGENLRIERERSEEARCYGRAWCSSPAQAKKVLASIAKNPFSFDTVTVIEPVVEEEDVEMGLGLLPRQFSVIPKGSTSLCATVFCEICGKLDLSKIGVKMRAHDSFVPHDCSPPAVGSREAKELTLLLERNHEKQGFFDNHFARAARNLVSSKGALVMLAFVLVACGLFFVIRKRRPPWIGRLFKLDEPSGVVIEEIKETPPLLEAPKEEKKEDETKAESVAAATSIVVAASSLAKVALEIAAFKQKAAATDTKIAMDENLSNLHVSNSILANQKTGFCPHLSSALCEHRQCWMCCKIRTCHSTITVDDKRKDLQRLGLLDAYKVESEAPATKKKGIVYFDEDGKVVCKKQNFHLFALSRRALGKWVEVPGKDFPLACTSPNCALSHKPSKTKKLVKLSTKEGLLADALALFRKKKPEEKVSPPETKDVESMFFLGKTCRKWMDGKCKDSSCTFGHNHLPLCRKYVNREPCDGYCKHRHYLWREGPEEEDKAFAVWLEKLDGVFAKHYWPNKEAMLAELEGLLREGDQVTKARKRFAAKQRTILKNVRHSGPRHFTMTNKAWQNTSTPDDDTIRFTDRMSGASEAAFWKAFLRNRGDLHASRDNIPFNWDTDLARELLVSMGMNPEEKFDRDFIRELQEVTQADGKLWREFIFDSEDDLMMNDRGLGFSAREEMWEKKYEEYRMADREALIVKNPIINQGDLLPYLAQVWTIGSVPQYVNATYGSWGNKRGFLVVKHAFETDGKITADMAKIVHIEEEHKVFLKDAKQVAQDLLFFEKPVPNIPAFPMEDYTESVPNVKCTMLYYDEDRHLKFSVGVCPQLNSAPFCNYDCSSQSGACSAPVWSLRLGKPKVMGFHVATSGRGASTVNHFMPLSPALREMLVKGTECSLNK